VLATEYADTVPWLLLTGGALAAWLVLFALVATATMPTLPAPGAETTEIGPEPPALANLLVNRCKVTSSAVAATLLDLTTRGAATIEQIGDGQHLLRLRRNRPATTTPYEVQVLELVDSRARDGTTPAAELSLGYGATADAWWKRFERAVVDDARQRGLVRRRFSRLQAMLLAGTLIVPSALFGVAFEVYGAAARAQGESMDEGGGIWAAFAVWVVLVSLGARRLRGWRETRQGDEVSARWLGVRQALRNEASLAEAPAAGVVVWEQLLAYAVALGVARRADADLPIGPTRHDEGWSPYRGLWRQVRIRYPRRFAYGEAPVRVAILSGIVVVGLALALVLGRAVVAAAFEIVGEAFDDDNDAASRQLALALSLLFAALVGVVGFYAGRSLITLRRALADLAAGPETVEGYVVRVPWHRVSDGDGGTTWQPMGYTAVDDGTTDDEVRALRHYDSAIREGQVVRVTVTPNLRHVVRMEPVVAGSSSPEGPAGPSGPL
jgi:hypothetical protein